MAMLWIGHIASHGLRKCGSCWQSVPNAVPQGSAGILASKFLRSAEFLHAFTQLRDGEIAWIIQQVAEYVERQRETYRGRAVPLDGHQRLAVQAFFPASTLNAARVIALAAERVSNPPFYPELHRMGFEPSALPNFSLMAAITFVDTVVSHEQFTDRLLFHELVHVIQYEKLGLKGFASKYVRGFLRGGSYEAIPLEANAYELEARFATAATTPFSAEDEVQSWIDSQRF